MNEELKVIISAEISKLKSNLDRARNEISGLQKSAQRDSAKIYKDFDNAAKKIGDSVQKACKVAVTAFAGITMATAGFVASSVKNYAEYEQLVGGVNKLFGDASQAVMQYAQDAYKNAGISANEYMEQITSFSASLISSLGGDTQKAAEIGNMAINDMADNANTFGTSIESIQNAYQGFAKQNYTMLDNLKLGYGGTKEEMQRLIDKANEVRAAQGINTQLTIDSYADVVTAIHTVQEEMGIYGTTAQEAENTVSGSIASTKAAWSNLMTGLADSNANIPQLVQNVISSATSILNNIIPIVKEVLKNIPIAIREISPEAADAFQSIVDIIMAVLPTLKEALKTTFTVISNVIQFVKEHKTLISIIAGIILSIVAAIEAYNIIIGIKTALDTAAAIATGALTAAQAAFSAVCSPVILIIGAVVAAIAALVAIIVACVKHWDEIKATVSKCWNSIKSATTDAVNTVKNKFNEMKEKVSEKVSQIKESVSQKFNDVKQIMGNAMEVAKNTIKEKLNNIKTAYQENGGGIKGVVSAAMEGIKGYYSAGYSYIDNLTGGKLSAVANKFKNKMSEAKQAVSIALDNIKNKFSTMIESAKNIVSNGLKRIKNFFNFKWELPRIKLPHFSITGKFSLNPPQIPHFSVSWYKLGGVFNSPTLFPYGNGKMGGLGEDGAEAIVPLEKNTKWLDRIASMLAEKQGSGSKIILTVDGRAFGEIACNSINDLTRVKGSLPLVLG